MRVLSFEEEEDEEEGMADSATPFTDGDLSMFAMDEDGELSELASRRRPDEAEIKFVSR